MYEVLMDAACGCNGTLACAALDRAEQLQVHANLASTLMLLAREPAIAAPERAFLLGQSAHHWSVPLALVPKDEGLRYYHALVEADADIARKLADAMPLAVAAAAEGREASILPIERVDVSSLSRAQFLARYALPKVPVVLTGLAELFARTGAGALPNLTDIVRACADRSVRLQRGVGTELGGGRVEDEQSVAPAGWAGLVQAAGTVTLGRLFDELERGGAAEGWQLFDWALPRQCAQAAQLPAVRGWLPAHLAPTATGEGSGGDVDILRELPPDAADAAADGAPRCVLAGGWPSLFLQPAGSGCAAHVDSYGSHFWQLLLNGTKRWRVAHADDTHLLEVVPPRLRTLRVSSLFSLAYDRHPQLRLLRLREAELQPGELLFVPAGAAHQVLNARMPGAHGGETGARPAASSLVAALSANFIDGSNAREAARELYFGAQLGQARDVACTHAHVSAALESAEAAVARVADGFAHHARAPGSHGQLRGDQASCGANQNAPWRGGGDGEGRARGGRSSSPFLLRSFFSR